RARRTASSSRSEGAGMKTTIAAALALSLGVGGATRAQDGSLPVQQFAPAPGGDNNFVTVQGSGLLAHLTPAAGIYLNYAHEPLILLRIGTDEVTQLVEHQLQVDLVAALGILDVLEVGLAIPLTIYQTQGASSA